MEILKAPLFRKMTFSDADKILQMMRTFYASPAVLTNGSDEIFRNDIQECVSDSPFAKGFVFEVNGEIAGYGMLAFSYSTEFGKRCVWIEDVYVNPKFRGQGIATQFLDFVKKEFPNHLHRLEVEKDNDRAIRVYKKSDFSEFPYLEMIRNAKA